MLFRSQVTLGSIVVKAGARKVRRLHHDRVLAGFAGATADAFHVTAPHEKGAGGAAASSGWSSRMARMASPPASRATGILESE